MTGISTSWVNGETPGGIIPWKVKMRTGNWNNEPSCDQEKSHSFL